MLSTKYTLDLDFAGGSWNFIVSPLASQPIERSRTKISMLIAVKKKLLLGHIHLISQAVVKFQRAFPDQKANSLLSDLSITSEKKPSQIHFYLFFFFPPVSSCYRYNNINSCTLSGEGLLVKRISLVPMGLLPTI